MTEIQIPTAFRELFQPRRFKIYYGGRGGAKSHNFGRALLTIGAMKPTRILCARELQGSISDSVHKLLSDIIAEYPEFRDFYHVQQKAINGSNGTEFIFKGLKHNVSEVKSTEGIDICWVEEAEKVSDSSWEVLIPTIRKNNSEIWISFNPKHPDDPTYQRFVEHADEDMFVKKVSWRENPFFPEVLEKERLRLQRTDPLAYKHIWEGEFDERRNGCIFANKISEARAAGRITFVPYEEGIPVFTAWDLGKRHATSIWFGQVVGLQPRVLDYHEASGDDADLAELARVIREKPFAKDYVMHYLPHDGAHSRLGMQGSISDQLNRLGVKNKVIPIANVSAGIEQTKAFIAKAWFDEEKTKDGLHACNHYHYEWDDNRQRFKDNPFDDWSADGSDALRYLASVVDKHHQKEVKSTSMYDRRGSGGAHGWLS